MIALVSVHAHCLKSGDDFSHTQSHVILVTHIVPFFFSFAPPINHAHKNRDCARLMQSIKFIALIYAGAVRIALFPCKRARARDTKLHSTAFHQNTSQIAKRICHVLFIFIIYLTPASVSPVQVTETKTANDISFFFCSRVS